MIWWQSRSRGLVYNLTCIDIILGDGITAGVYPCFCYIQLSVIISISWIRPCNRSAKKRVVHNDVGQTYIALIGYSECVIYQFSRIRAVATIIILWGFNYGYGRVLTKGRCSTVIGSGSRSWKVTNRCLIWWESRSCGLVYNLTCIDIILGDGITAGIHPCFGYIQLSVIVSISWIRSCNRSTKEWVVHNDVGQTYIAFIGYSECVIDQFSRIRTVATIVIHCCFYYGYGRVLTKGRYGTVIGSGSRPWKIANSSHRRCCCGNSRLIYYLACIDIILGDGITTGIHPCFGYIQLSVIISISWIRARNNSTQQRITYNYIIKAHIAFVGYCKSIVDQFSRIWAVTTIIVHCCFYYCDNRIKT